MNPINPRPRLRLVYDVYELSPGHGKSIGIYKYSQNLLSALAETAEHDIEIVVLANSQNTEDFAHKSPRLRVLTVSDRFDHKLNRLLWSLAGGAWFARKLKADVYLAPKGFLPRFINRMSPRTRSIIVVHDLIPLWYLDNYPGMFGRFEEWVVNNALTSSVRRSDRIVAISRATADDIFRRLGRTSGVEVVHNGVPLVAPGISCIESPYIFAVTSSVPHKNAAGILKTYSRYRELVESPLPLVVCGLPRCDDPGVLAVRNIDDSTMHAYYAHAELFLFLPLVEGFGFPPVEAFSHGTPVVCSDIDALVEVAKGLAHYVPPTDVEAVAAAMCTVLRTGRSQAEEDKRRDVAAGYTWDACARRMLDLIRSLDGR